MAAHLDNNGKPACGRKTTEALLSKEEFCGDDSVSPLEKIGLAYRHCSMCARRIKKEILEKENTTYSELLANHGKYA